MKVLVIAAAGKSERFSRSVGKDTIKCIFHKKDFSESLLYRLIHQPVDFDKYVIVGGCGYDALKQAVNEHFPEYSEKIILTENTHYEDYGSGYSLFLGLSEAMKLEPETVVFAEGDLYIDPDSYIKVCSSEKSVITCNSEPITADKAVAFYLDGGNGIRYIYDTSHSLLSINEPFRAIYNSGQIWKFSSVPLIRKTMSSMTENDWTGTNLIMIEKYFRSLRSDEYELVKFEKWINCNTLRDFEKI